MVVLSSILGGASSPIAWGGARGLGRSSRLYRALIDGEIASSVSAGYELTLDPYLFASTPRCAGVEPARRSSHLREIERIQREGVPDDELARTNRQLHAQVVYSLEGVTNQGFALGFMDLVAGDAAAWETFPEALQSVTSDDVQRVASTYLVEQAAHHGWFPSRPTGGAADGHRRRQRPAARTPAARNGLVLLHNRAAANPSVWSAPWCGRGQPRNARRVRHARADRPHAAPGHQNIARSRWPKS